MGKARESSLLVNVIVSLSLVTQSAAQGSITKFDSINSAPSGGISVTISGLSFGTNSYTPTLQIGANFDATTTSWTSATTVQVLPNSALYYTSHVDLKPYFRDTIGTYTSTTDYYTFDAPTVSFALTQGAPSPNTAQSGGSSVTITGLNFASNDRTATVRARAICQTNSWTSATTLSCQTAYATQTDTSLGESVTVGGQAGTFASSLFSFDAPVLSAMGGSVFTANSPTSGGATLTVYGSNFGTVNFTPTAHIHSGYDKTQCATTSWTTNTAILCEMSAGYGRKQFPAITVNAVTGTRSVPNSPFFSFDSPVVSFNHPANAPARWSATTGHNEGAYVTIYGLNFAPIDGTPTSFINNGGTFPDNEICQTTSWTTGSTVKCMASYYGVDSQRTLAVGGLGSSGIGGTTFTYDGPILTSNFEYNQPSSGGTTVTISGLNFGYINATPESYVGISYCTTTSWSSSTTVQCNMPTAGQGTNPVILGRRSDVNNKYFGTRLLAFTFDAPTVSFATPGPSFANGPPTGGLTLSVTGFNFGNADFSQTGGIAWTSCDTLSWKSATSINCVTPKGTGLAKRLAVTVGAVVGTLLTRFTFDAPVLTNMNPSNGPSQSGYVLTVLGENYGVTNVSPSVRLGATTCASSEWVSNTQVKCITATGFSGNHQAMVTISAVVGTRLARFTFDAPVPTHVSAANAPTSTGTSVTMVGMSFGSVDFSPTVALDPSVCATTSWSTATSVACLTTASGYGTKVALIVTVGAIVGTRMNKFTYDAPVISDTDANNVPTSANAVLTLYGLNFGSGLPGSPTAFLGTDSTQCLTTSWSTSSLVRCHSAGGSRAEQAISHMVSSALAGTALTIFTFDSPTASFYDTPNTPTTGGVITTVGGINFGIAVLTSTIRIGSTKCSTVSWSSVSSLQCWSSPGYGDGHTVAITVSGLIGTEMAKFSYDSPALTYARQFNTPTCSDVSVTIQGINFGSSDRSASATISSTLCASSQWSSNTAIKCSTPPGFGKGLHLAITMANLVGTAHQAGWSGFTYDAPVVSYIHAKNLPTTSGGTVSLSGFNFAESSATQTMAIADTVCATTSWATITSVYCTSPNAEGSANALTLTVGTQVWSRSSAFTYDAPVISRSNTFNLPTSTGYSVTLLGTNFGYFNPTATANIGDDATVSQCATSSWNSATSISCRATALGFKEGLSIPLTVTTTVGTGYLAFSYDSPLVSVLLPYNGMSAGAGAYAVAATPGTVTVLGFNFAGTDPSATVAIHAGQCRTTSWSTGTNLKCVTANSAGGAAHTVAVTIASLIGTVVGEFTYDAPILSGAENMKANLVTTAGASVTLYGFNFGGLAPTPSVHIGKTMCVTTSWTTNTALTCVGPYGSGSPQSVSVTVSTTVGTKVDMYSYDAPVISGGTFDINAPSSGGGAVTVKGVNFLDADLTPTVTIKSNICLSSSWTSTTTTICIAPPNVGYTAPGVRLGLTISAIVGCAATTFFSYDAPVMSNLGGINGPSSGGGDVTMFGMNFGADDATPTAILGGSVVGTVSWTTYSSVKAMTSTGTAAALEVLLTVSSMVGTVLSGFTYDAPILTNVRAPNGPTTGGGASITIAGTNFAAPELTVTVAISRTTCATTKHVSATSLVCSGPSGSDVGHYTVVTVGQILGTQLAKFTYDAPTLTSLMPYNSATCGAASVSLNGVNFGAVAYTTSAMLGGAACQTSAWSSASSVTCQSPVGYAAAQHSKVTVSGLVATFLSGFTYDAPVATFLVQNAPTLSSATLSLVGINFATTNPSATAKIGSTACPTSSWVSTTLVLCRHPDGYTTSHNVVMTVAGLIGTKTQTFSYDSPVVTFMNRFNSPTTAAASLTVVGTNFATSDPTASVVIGLTYCVSTSWTSGTSVTCSNSDGWSTTTHASLIVKGLIGTNEKIFTYDSPVVTYADVFNQPISGGASLTLTGVNFASTDLSALGRIGQTGCLTTSYTSDTSLLCQGNIGSGAELNNMLTVSSLVGTRVDAFSFDTPITSSLLVPNIASTADSTITLLGVNFGLAELSETIAIGSTVCHTAAWASNTHIYCKARPGIGALITTTVEMTSLLGTFALKFSYDAPAASYLRVPNGPTSGGTTLTLAGLNFGMEDYTMSVFVASVASSTASWTSETQVRLTTSADVGFDHKSVVTVASLLGTLTGSFSYDAPAISSSVQVNIPTSGIGQVTVHGLNFGISDATPSTRVGATLCTTTVWTTNTQVICKSVEGTSIMHSVQMTLASAIGTNFQAFSYDAPVASQSLLKNSPITGSALLSVVGLNFAQIDTTSSIRIGATQCGTTTWSSSTALSCLSMPGMYTSNMATLLTISATVAGTLIASFSYDTPVISQTAPPNLATSTGSSVTVYGFNFGNRGNSPTMSIGASSCSTTSWKSDSSVQCLATSAGAGPSIRSVISLSSLVGTLLKSFTYDSPTVTFTNLENSPTCGLYSITLTGFNFAMYNYTPSSRIGISTCRTTTWTSVSSVACELAAGNGIEHASSISIVSLVGTQLASFTYDAPVVSYRNTDNGPMSGGTSVTLYGSNFGMSNTSPSGSIGSSMCQSTVWVKDTSVVCTTPKGANIGLDLVLTVGAMISTTEDTFSYDSPVITFNDNYNIPTTSGGQVTVMGMNFGAEDWTPSIRIHSTICSTTSWTTTSSVTCVGSSGFGISRDTIVTLSGTIGTVSALFSYDSPIVTGLTLGNSATTGGKSVTIQGGNFAVEDGTMTALVGTSMCATTSWTSSSVVTCLLGGASAGSNFQVAVTLVGLVGTKQKVFTFDSPAISFTYQFNSPLSGHPSITLSGTNFASQNYSMNGFVGASTCLTTSWMSVTSAKCLVGPGFGQGLTSSLTVSNLIGTRNLAFSYDSPTVTYATAYNAPNSAGISVTLSGTNFGATDYSVTVQVAETACITSKWVSMTSATCELAQGVGVGPTSSASEHRVAITVGTGVGTRTRSFTFDAPVVTYAVRFNAASTGGQSVTVTGVNFGLIDYSVTVGIGKTACMTTTWSSNTGLLCAAPAGGGYGYQIAVTAMGIDGTLATMFSYDAPVLTRAAQTNAPASGNAAVTLHGTGFGLADNTPSVYLSRTSCGSTSWTTMSSVTCYSSYGTGMAYDIALTVSSMVGTEQMAFTYDSPVLSQMLGENGPITGGASVTLAGSNFGVSNLTPTTMIGGTLCATSMWISTSAVRCATSLEGGYGTKKSGMVELTGLSGTILKTFTYDSPVISVTEVVNGPSTTGARVTISGSDFGQMNLTPTARVGKTRCATTAWMSSTSLSCSLASGAGSTLHSGVALFGLEATLADVFTYNAPVISTIGSNGPATGGTSLTILGSNFGAEDFSASARIGSTACSATEWIGTTTVVCATPAGGKTAVAESLTVAGVVGTQTGMFSYDGPKITALWSANAPLTGSAPISFMGMNFVQSDLTTTTTLMHTVCLTTSWTSDSTVTCRSIAGYGTAKVTGITVHSVVNTNLASFTFDGPVLTDSSPPNHPTSSGSSVTVSGLNFVSVDVTPTLRMGLTMCTTASWSTATTVSCAAAAITGSGTHSISLEIESLIIGTLYNGYSFDAPVSSYSKSYNGAASGGSSVTVIGLNFASTDTSATIRVGGAVCTTSSWATATTLYCMNSAASGVAQSVAVEVTSIVGSQSATFTYDAPASSHATVLNSPSSGGASVSVYGSNFGMSDFTPSIQIGSSLCATASWTTTTQVKCRTQVGFKSDQTGVVLVSGMIGTHTNQKFTYDSPAVTHSVRMNAPTTKGASVTVSGINFYGEDLTATMLIGSVLCETTTWASMTALSCLTPDGAGLAKSLVVLQDALSGTQYLAFTYDAPVLTFVATPNAPTSGSSVTTILGTNFGASDLSATAKVGGTNCASTDWNTETSILCLMPVGFGIKRTVEVVVSDNIGDLPAGFTYDTAVLTDIQQNNGATAGGTSLTLSGFNFVSEYDPTASVRIGTTGCHTTSWSSVSAVTCLSPIGNGQAQLISVTLGEMVGSLSDTFTYDSPAVTVVSNPNMPSTAGTSVTVSGINFGMDDGTPTVTIGSLDCSSVRKFSDTSILCKPTAASGTSHSVVLETFGAVGTLITAFTYDAPAVTFITRFNTPTCGGASLTIQGMNIGVSDYSSTVKIANTKCATSSWKSDTSVVCLSKAGNGLTKTVSISVTNIVGTGLEYFSYDAPVVTSSALVNAAGSGQIFVTIGGMNFADVDTSGGIKLGTTSCGTASWSSGTSLTCYLLNSGNGIGLKISADADSVAGTGLMLFSYDAPVTTFITRSNSATTAGTVVSIAGANFGHENFSGTAYIGITGCTLSTYVTNSLVTCTVPQGSGQQRRIVFSRDGVSGTMSRAFSYDAPVVTHTLLANGPAKSGASLMVEGTNFGPQGTSPTVLIGISWCTNSEWVSTTSLRCITPDGTASAHNVGVVVTSLVGSSVEAFTYDAPLLTGMSAYNGPMVSGAELTLFGLNFGNTDVTPTITVGATACPTVTWRSDSDLVCLTPSGASTGSAVSLSLGGVEVAKAASFTHDSPVITDFGTVNGPTAGGSVVTLFGLNFGAVNLTPTASIGAVPCTGTTYVSSSSVLCTVAAGGGQANAVSAALGSLSGEVSSGFSYDTPSIMQVTPARGYYIGRNVVTVTGTNFGSSTSNAVVSIGGTACLTSSWVSSTTLQCTVPPASQVYVKPRSVMVTIGTESNTLANAFTFTSPTELLADCLTGNCTVPAFNLTSDSVTIVQVSQNQANLLEHKYTIAGSVGLAGRLHIVFQQGLIPARTKCWEFFSGTGFTGTFAQITTNLDSVEYTNSTWTSLATVCTRNTVWSTRVAIPGCDSVALGYTDCTGHGTCNQATGSCECDAGYGGTKCDSVCFYNASNVASPWDCSCARLGADAS